MRRSLMKQSYLKNAPAAVLAVAGVCLALSCSLGKTESALTYDELMEEKTEAEGEFSAAQEEYAALFSGSSSARAAATDNDDADFDHLSLQDKITLAAWNAYNTGDDTEVISLLKENNLYDKCMDIIDKYNLEDAQEVIATPSRSAIDGNARAVTKDFITGSTHRTGDIVLCYGGATSSSGVVLGLVIPGTWKHSGLIDHGAPEGYAVFSASNETNTYLADSDGVVGRVGWETATKWSLKDGVCAVGVPSATDKQAKAAVTYASQFSGKPYNLAVSRGSNASWYCSKVVYRAYESQGFDLEYHTWYYLRGPWVTPQDLFDDSDTSYIDGDKS